MMICLLGTKARGPFQFKIAIAIDLTIEITSVGAGVLTIY